MIETLVQRSLIKGAASNTEHCSRQPMTSMASLSLEQLYDARFQLPILNGSSHHNSG